MCITSVLHPHCWKVTTTSKDSNESQEIVFSIQGILCMKDLPPLVKRLVFVLCDILYSQQHVISRSNNPRFLRQGIQITGLNTPMFQKSIHGLFSIHALLGHEFPDGFLHEFEADKFMEYGCINLAKQYLTFCCDNPYSVSVPFPSAVDPNGCLTSMCTDSYFHGADNDVLYFHMLSPQSSERLK